MQAHAGYAAEHIIVPHCFGRVKPAREAALAAHIRAIQTIEEPTASGGWPVWHGGPLDLWPSVLAYVALRAAGDAPTEKHMVKASDAILSVGGIEKVTLCTSLASHRWRDLVALVALRPTRATAFAAMGPISTLPTCPPGAA